MRVSAHVVSSLQWHVHASSDQCGWTACIVHRCSICHLLLLPGWPDGSMFFSRSRPADKSVMLAPCGGLGLPQPPLAVSPSQIVRCCALMSCQILSVSLARSRHRAFAQALWSWHSAHDTNQLAQAWSKMRSMHDHNAPCRNSEQSSWARDSARRCVWDGT